MSTTSPELSTCRFGYSKRKVRDAVIVLVISVAGPFVPFALVIAVWMMFGFDIPNLDIRRVGVVGGALIVTLWMAILFGNALQARRILSRYTVTEQGVTRDILGRFRATKKWRDVNYVRQERETVFDSFQASEQRVIHIVGDDCKFKVYEGIDHFERFRSLVLDAAYANSIRFEDVTST
jgi:hypothetical protein